MLVSSRWPVIRALVHDPCFESTPNTLSWRYVQLQIRCDAILEITNVFIGLSKHWFVNAFVAADSYSRITISVFFFPTALSSESICSEKHVYGDIQGFQAFLHVHSLGGTVEVWDLEPSAFFELVVL